MALSVFTRIYRVNKKLKVANLYSGLMPPFCWRGSLEKLICEYLKSGANAYYFNLRAANHQEPERGQFGDQRAFDDASPEAQAQGKRNRL
jgi:hypothetical protein